MSDVNQHAKYPKADRIEIFAPNKVIFDADIGKINSKNGRFVIIARTWAIITDKNESFRNIWLTGANGDPHENIKADDENLNDPNGKDGHEGNPGIAWRKHFWNRK